MAEKFKEIYRDANSLAYEKNGVRYSVMHAKGRVLVTEVAPTGEVAEYAFDLDDAIAALSNGSEADIAADFVRRLKRKRGAQLFRQSVKILFKLTAHLIFAAIFAFAAGVLCQKFWGIL